MVTTFDPQNSNHIQRLNYNPDDQYLEVTFKDTSTAIYANVPPKVFNEMVSFGSIGTYYHRVIRVHYREVGRTHPEGKN